MYSAILLDSVGRLLPGLNQRDLPVLQHTGDRQRAGGSLIPGSIFRVILIWFRRGMSYVFVLELVDLFVK